MNSTFTRYIDLPGFHYEHDPASERRSSASYTGGISKMEREFSNSSHVTTESSKTTSYKHSNIGDWASSPYRVTSHVPPDAFCWNNGQTPVDHDNSPTADLHGLVHPTTLPQLVLNAEGDFHNIGSSVNGSDALFESIIDKLRQEYFSQQDRLTYAQNLARAHGMDPINNFVSFGEQTAKNPTSTIPPRSDSQYSSGGRGEYQCLLCHNSPRLFDAGTFKRHVNEMHNRKSIFLCMHCTWSHPRRHKLRDHIRIRHPEEGVYSAEELNGRELLLEVPSTCTLCEPHRIPTHQAPFNSWKSWFECIKDHCRVEGNQGGYMESGSNPHGGGDDGWDGGGSAGGAGGGYFPNTPFRQGPSAGESSSGQEGIWFSETAFPQWTASCTQAGSISHPPKRSLTEQTCVAADSRAGCSRNQSQSASKPGHTGPGKGALVVSSSRNLKKLGHPTTEIFSKKDLSRKTRSGLADLSNIISKVSSSWKPKTISRLRSSTPISLSVKKDLESIEKDVFGGFLLSKISQVS